jgi:hypothetical protein
MPYSVIIDEICRMIDKIDMQELMKYIKEHDHDLYNEIVVEIEKSKICVPLSAHC